MQTPFYIYIYYTCIVNAIADVALQYYKNHFRIWLFKACNNINKNQKKWERINKSMIAYSKQKHRSLEQSFILPKMIGTYVNVYDFPVFF